jgi:hypothetical protein
MNGIEIRGRDTISGGETSLIGFTVLRRQIMLKKLYSIGAAALLVFPAAFAAITTTTYDIAPTIVVGNCTISGAASLSYNSSTNILTLVNATDNCDNNNNNNQTDTPTKATISFNSSSYTQGSSAAPVITVNNTTLAPPTGGTAPALSCKLTPPSGFTANSSSSATVTVNAGSTGTFTIGVPTSAQGSYNFSAPICTTSAAGYTSTATVTPTILSLTVSNNQPPPGGCVETQLSTPIGPNNVTFKRQCSGGVVVYPTGVGIVSASTPNGVTDLGAVLGNTSFPKYSYNGYSPTFTITSGYYIAMAFTPTTTGSMQFTANTSWGHAGAISLSTSPGGLTKGASGVICAYNSGVPTIYISTTSGGGACVVNVGTTYYINIADTDANGSRLCWNGTANSCSVSTVSYTLYR